MPPAALPEVVAWGLCATLGAAEGDLAVVLDVDNHLASGEVEVDRGGPVGRHRVQQAVGKLRVLVLGSMLGWALWSWAGNLFPDRAAAAENPAVEKT